MQIIGLRLKSDECFDVPISGLSSVCSKFREGCNWPFYLTASELTKGAFAYLGMLHSECNLSFCVSLSCLIEWNILICYFVAEEEAWEVQLLVC